MFFGVGAKQSDQGGGNELNGKPFHALSPPLLAPCTVRHFVGENRALAFGAPLL